MSETQTVTSGMIARWINKQQSLMVWCHNHERHVYLKEIIDGNEGSHIYRTRPLSGSKGRKGHVTFKIECNRSGYTLLHMKSTDVNFPKKSDTRISQMFHQD